MQFLDLPAWEQAFRGLMALLCQLIYPLMSFLYELFNNITQINILSTDEIAPIYQRVTMLLTIIMIFYITFQFVKYVVQPDTLTDKEKGAGNIVYKLVIVVVLIAFVPTIFNIAFDVQKAIISKNVIAKVVLGPQAITDESNMGSAFSATVFNMFYYAKEESKNKDCHDGVECDNLVNMNVTTLKTDNTLNSITIGLNKTDDSNTALINFDGLLAVIVGGFIVYILALYCIDVGVRWVQILYLQIIAPIPILGYLSPKKDGIFQKWTQQCLTTYLDLFLRIAIINIILLLCDVLLKSKLDPETDLLAGLGELSFMMETLIYVVLIMAVMLFAHKAPKMLAELFPKMGAASGNFGLSAKDRYEPTLKALKGGSRIAGGIAGTAIGAVVGAGTGLAQGLRRAKALNKNGNPKGVGAGVWGATKGAIGGLVGGATRGLYNGSKKGNVFKNSIAGAQKQVQANQRFGNREEQGYTFGHQVGDKARSITGVKSRTEALESTKAPIKRQDEALKHITDTESSIKKRALEKIEEGSAKNANTKAAADNWSRKKTRAKDLDDPMSDARKEYQVGSVKDDAASKSAYQKELAEKKQKISAIDESKISAGIQDASLGVNKDNFKMTIKEPQYDELAHEKAKTQFIKDTGKLNEDGSPILEFDEAGWKAAKSQFVTSKESEIFDNQSYQKALQEARSRRVAEIKQTEIDKIENEFAQKVQGYVYQSSEEAEMALAAAKNLAAAELDEAQKEVIAEYVRNEGDGAITQMVTELQAHIDGDKNGMGGYNRTASSERKLDVDYDEIIQNFKAFSDKVKKDDDQKYPGNYRSTINRNAAEIINIDTEIDKIKRQTDGTQDKKS